MDKGESAFPWQEHNDDGSHFHDHPGMTMRDYFAAKALQGFIAAHSGIDVSIPRDFQVMASYCYECADAMLAARGSAQLIAAAPDLFAALTRMLDAFHEDPLQANTGAAVEEAYAAIAKAKGV